MTPRPDLDRSRRIARRAPSLGLARYAPPLIGATLFAASCGEHLAPPGGPSVAIAVAPLSLPDIAYACYDLRVRNDLEQTVWSLGTAAAEGAAPSVCSNQYGNDDGGDITYIGPCDASENDPDDLGTARNTVTLWLDGLYDADGVDLGDYQNPCPWPNGCTLAFDCLPNADVQVPFDLTVMRRANQGFFDVAVNFDDIFCSAKVDCQYDDGSTIALLHGKDGQRHPTTAVAFACTAGEEADTHLYLDTLVVRCQDPVSGQFSTLTTIDPSAGTGNIFATPKGPPIPGQPSDDDDAVVWQYAIYQGTAHDDQVLYWNLALGLNLAPAPAGHVCYLDAIATASDGPLPGGATPVNSTYPVIQFHVALNPDGTPTLACGQNPLNGGAPVIEGLTTPTDPGVSTGYSAPGEPECFNGGMTYHAISNHPVGFDAGCGVTTRVFHDVDLNGVYDPAIDVVHPDTEANLYVSRVDDPTVHTGGGLFAGNAQGLTTFTKYADHTSFRPGDHSISLRRVFSTLPCPPDTSAFLYSQTDVTFPLDPTSSYFMEFPYACVSSSHYVGGNGTQGIKARVFEDLDGDFVYTPGVDVLTAGQAVAMLLPEPWNGGIFHTRSALVGSDADGIAFFPRYDPGAIGAPSQPLLLNVRHHLVLVLGIHGHPLPAQCTHGAEATRPVATVRPPAYGTDLIVDMPFRCLPAPPPTPAPVTVIQYHDANRNGVYDLGVDIIAGPNHGLFVYAGGLRERTLASDASGTAVLTAYDQGPLTLSSLVLFHTGPRILPGAACPAGFSYSVVDDPATATDERTPTFRGSVTTTPQTYYLPTGCYPDELTPGLLRVVAFHDANGNGVFDPGVDPRATDGRWVSLRDNTQVGSPLQHDFVANGFGEVVWQPISFRDVDYFVSTGNCPAGFTDASQSWDPSSDFWKTTPIGASSTTVFAHTGCVGTGASPGLLTIIQFHDVNGNAPIYDPGIDLIAGPGLPVVVDDTVTLMSTTLMSDANGAAEHLPLTFHNHWYSTGIFATNGQVPVCPTGFVYEDPWGYANQMPITSSPLTVYSWTGCGAE